MSTNMLIDGYVVTFDNFKKFTPKDATRDYDSCFLKVNITNYSKDTNGKNVYTMVDLYATGKTAEFLDQYDKGDRIICNADFNGINIYPSGQEMKANIKATVRNIILFAPKDKNGNNNATNGAPQVGAPQVNNNTTQPPQITPPQGFNSSTGTAPVIDIPQPSVNPTIDIPQPNTSQGRRKRS